MIKPESNPLFIETLVYGQIALGNARNLYPEIKLSVNEFLLCQKLQREKLLEPQILRFFTENLMESSFSQQPPV